MRLPESSPGAPGRLLPGVERLKKAELAALVRGALADPRRRDLSLYAANGAYSLFLSLGPLTALVLSLLPYTHLTEEQLLGSVFSAAPRAFRRLVQGVVLDVYAGSRAILGLSLAAELWSGARFLAAVTGGVAALAGEADAGFFRRRLRGAALTLALIVLLLGDLLLLLFGERVLLSAAAVVPGVYGLWRAVLRLRPLLFFLGLTAGNTLLFRFSPRSRRRLREILPGAAFSAAGWMLFSRAYSAVMERFGLFGVYGSIAAAAVSLYWIYISLYILFLGVWLSALRRSGIIQ